jgi:hypothetical protein
MRNPFRYFNSSPGVAGQAPWPLHPLFVGTADEFSARLLSQTPTFLTTRDTDGLDRSTQPNHAHFGTDVGI